MLSLYRAWLGPSPCVARPAPPPGAHRPVPRRPNPKPPTPLPPPSPRSPSSTVSSELDVERIETSDNENESQKGKSNSSKKSANIRVDVEFPVNNFRKNTVVDVASCDGPVRFSRVLNTAWKEDQSWYRQRKRPTVHYYPCKTCGCKFPSYYFVHKHRKRCHGDEEKEPEASTSTAT